MKYQGITIFKNRHCNSWYARYRAGGKQYTVSAKTQMECYCKLKVALKNRDKIKNNPPQKQVENKITFKIWVDKWFKLYKSELKETTQIDYVNTLKHTKSLNSKELSEITSIEVLELLKGIELTRRRQKVYGLLKDIFNKAKQNKLIEDNPLESIDKPKHTTVKGIALTNEDEAVLEKILIEKKLDLYLVCLYQGLRRGEMLALTIDDVDFKNKTLSINKSINTFNKLSTTKNDYSNRIMPLFDITSKILEKYKNSKGRIFNFKRSYVEETFLKIVRDNFPGKKYTIHSLRHTFITKCQEKNIPLHIIQRWVGHNIGSKVTNTIYTHTRELAELENIEKMNI